MKSERIVPATLERDADGVPFSSRYGDTYHPPTGPFTQAAHVFLTGNGLPERWSGRERFVVLETGFGLGNNFLATRDAWQRDAAACRQLVFVSIERHPFTQLDLREAHRGSPLAALADELVGAWPPLTSNLHRLSFDDGRVVLLLAFGDVDAWLPELVASVDAFYLDGFAPAANPQMWQPRLFKAIGRLAATGASAATWSSARPVRDGLRTAGFEVVRRPGVDGKWHVTTARFAPAFTPRRGPSRLNTAIDGSRHAVVVGAGLAGCATAWALAEAGWRVTLLERNAQPAQETSGNAGGLFHGIVNAQDGAHARFNRSAAMHAAEAVRAATAQHGVAGSAQGLLRLEAELDLAAMHRIVQALGLPADYVRAVSASAASALAGTALRHPAWFYAAGGWVDPVGLARAFLERAGDAAQLRTGVAVDSIEHVDNVWGAIDAEGRPIAEAAVLVLANAADALRLAGLQRAPVEAVRGQVSVASDWPHALPLVPIAGNGYLLTLSTDERRVMFGASAHRADMDANVRALDHVQNVARLTLLLGETMPMLDIAMLQGRTGWRLQADDRLPLAGAVPVAHHVGRSDQPRFIARQPGLYMFTGLGSRGITWCTLGARCVAAAISGAPMPLEASLLDAIDPARFLCRSARRGLSDASSGQPPVDSN